MTALFLASLVAITGIVLISFGGILGYATGLYRPATILMLVGLAMHFGGFIAIAFLP